jgi:DHA1 family tetracycline resistance protein-like MFS transporter
MAAPRPNKAAFVFIFVTVLLDVLALGLVIPVGPKLIEQLEGGDIADAAGVIGIFGTAWAGMQFAFSPLLGMASDRFGRRPVVLLSNLGLGLDYLVMALAPSIGVLFVGRLLSGLTSASLPTAHAYIADVTPPEERPARYGLLGAAFGLGFVIGPAVGGLLAAIALRLPFWVAGGMSLLNAAYGFFILPESLPPERRGPVSWAKANPLGSLQLLRSHSELLGLAAVVAACHVAHESVPPTMVLYADYRYHWSEADVGLFLAALGVATTVVSALLVRRAVAALGERRALLVGLAFGTASFFGFGLAPNGAAFLGMIPLFALWGLAGPPLMGLMSNRIAASEQGQLQGALQSLRGVIGIFAPLLYTQLFRRGIKDAGRALPGAPYLLAGGLMFAGLVLAAAIARDPEPAAVEAA